ncbi:hypothetical protein QJS04_geneDACA003512 [Acorus gramineus]|uniref:Uncharacterized protein n=1 Tax=Acorus gramineus TaxID=55184 RepID=A0AAV9BM83_ACOGR|nr:hypothetical protein QJS04_geneDACA003512 [Acorus gramineus]
MDFLRDVGFSTPDLIFLLSQNPNILTSSLDNQIVPAYGFLKGILGTDEVVVTTAKRAPWFLHSDLHKAIGSKIGVLRDHGVPDSSIAAMVKRQPRFLLIAHLDRFTDAITKVKAMDFRPSSSLFYVALGSILSISESHWEEKFELYRSFGWSEDDILSVFKKQPQIMTLSKVKMRKMMNFFLKEPGLGLSIISSCPHLLLLSLEKTIIPRWSVIRVLTSHGILNKDANVSTIFKSKEEKFLEKYVMKYQEKVPQVLQAYHGKTVIEEGKETPKASDFTVSYLVNSCGLSTDSALRVSKVFQLKTTENPDSVLSFFKNHGFTDTQIAKMISCRPRLLSSKPNKSLKPKIEFLRDAGFSTADLTLVLSKNPTILTSSLDNQIVPAYGFLKGILGTRGVVVSTTKRAPYLLHSDLHKMIGPKIVVLRDHGVPDSSISALIKYQPRVFLIVHLDRFSEAITKVKAMDFRPSSSLFYVALGSILSISESHWEEKFELYRSFGWSEDDILSAFKKQPQIMTLSKVKMRKMMNFFLKEPGLGLSIISSWPHLLLFSLEKTIIPRWSVIRVLTSHGILKKDVNVSTIFKSKEKKFLEKYVIKYKEKFPQVLQAYHRKTVIEG